MFVIVVYDVGVERVTKICKYLKSYLHRVQNSVFEGELTESKLTRMKTGLAERLDMDEDSVILWVFASEKVVNRQSIGMEKFPVTNIF